jgi:hypothetical protein
MGSAYTPRPSSSLTSTPEDQPRGRSLGAALLDPTRDYARQLLPVLRGDVGAAPRRARSEQLLARRRCRAGCRRSHKG